MPHGLEGWAARRGTSRLAARWGAPKRSCTLRPSAAAQRIAPLSIRFVPDGVAWGQQARFGPVSRSRMAGTAGWHAQKEGGKSGGKSGGMPTTCGLAIPATPNGTDGVADTSHAPPPPGNVLYLPVWLHPHTSPCSLSQTAAQCPSLDVPPVSSPPRRHRVSPARTAHILAAPARGWTGRRRQQWANNHAGGDNRHGRTTVHNPAPAPPCGRAPAVGHTHLAPVACVARDLEDIQGVAIARRLAVRLLPSRAIGRVV